jgi:hypothetical protein
VAGQFAASFPIDQIAHQAYLALAGTPAWVEVKARIVSGRSQVETFWSELDLPEMPSLDEVRRYVRERLAQTPSLEDIAVRVRERLLEQVFARLSETASSPQALPAA